LQHQQGRGRGSHGKEQSAVIQNPAESLQRAKINLKQQSELAQSLSIVAPEEAARKPGEV
jgi:hypothetical protein